MGLAANLSGKGVGEGDLGAESGGGAQGAGSLWRLAAAVRKKRWVVGAGGDGELPGIGEMRKKREGGDAKWEGRRGPGGENRGAKWEERGGGLVLNRHLALAGKRKSAESGAAGGGRRGRKGEAWGGGPLRGGIGGGEAGRQVGHIGDPRGGNGAAQAAGRPRLRPRRGGRKKEMGGPFKKGKKKGKRKEKGKKGFSRNKILFLNF